MTTKPNKPCTKARFKDEIAAMNFISILKRTSTRKDIPSRAYLCSKCLSWHVTKQNPDSEYKKQTNHLQQEIKRLNELLQEVNKADHKEAVKQARADLRVKELLKQIEGKDETIKRLRNTINELITKKP